MAEEIASYGVGLEDGISGPAGAAANSLRNLKSAMDKDTAALAQLQKAMRNLKAGGGETSEQMAKLKRTIEAKQAAIAKAQAKYLDMGGSVTRVAKQTASFRDRMQALQTQAAGMPGPFGRVVGMFDRFAKLVGGGAMAAGILAIAAGLIALTAAAVKASASLYEHATAHANARRSELLHLDAATKVWSALSAYYGLAKMKAADLQSGIDRVSASTALGRDQVAKYGQQLYQMGLRGKNWESALEGMTIKASTQGEAQASMFAGWAAGAALTGRSVEALTNRVKSQLGGIAKAQMLDADVQARKLGESFDAMFNGIQIEGLLKAKASLFSLFSQSTASGRYLTQLLGRIVQPMIDAVTRAIPIVKHFLQDCIIWALGVEIAWLRMRNGIRKVFSAKDWKQLISGALGELTPLKAGFAAVGAAIAIAMLPTLAGVALSAAAAAASFATMIGTALAGAAAVAAPFVLAGVAVAALVYMIRGIGQAWRELDMSALWKQIKADWDALDFGALGRAVLEGIAHALSDPLGTIGKAMRGLAGTAIDGFKTMLGIASPSRVFIRLGAALPEGMAAGIEQGQPRARAAVDDLAAPPPAMAPAMAPAPMPAVRPMAAAGGGGGARAGGSVTIQQLHVHAGDASTARTLAQDLKRELESVLEGVAMQMGAPNGTA